ncbi:MULTISPECIES: RagB/SusD family nutrient uptake outer membrane protein [unclassified Carboxylicivirga]|uniref:RagB/SusD family nutrient uptake outer membrane protein n=1 Tax=Carboxylicivirga TaxID=1628153 RepID=UPI003D34CA69
MKKLLMILVTLHLLITGCVDDFIEKPAVTGINLDEVFSSERNARHAIAEAYGANLSFGLPVARWAPPYLPYSTTMAIMGGEDVCGLGWVPMNTQCEVGMIANDAHSGAGYTDDYFPNNYIFIRKAWLVYENIYKATDMSDADKTIVEAEMQTLVAYRYLQMMKTYGGVPLVKETLTADNASIPRSTLQETFDYIVELCDLASETFGNKAWSGEDYGRINKGVALAIKAEAMMFAARPLFNAATPYLSMEDPAKNNLICFGNANPDRWQDAINANKAVIEWGMANGYELIDTDNPFDDYATAVGTMSNKEVLLAYKQQHGGNDNGMYKEYPIAFAAAPHMHRNRGITFEMLQKFRTADGTDQVWLNEGDRLPSSHYRARSEELETRALASLYFFGINAKNNPNDADWDVVSGSANWAFVWNRKLQRGCAKNCKFWYKAGRRTWFEFPLFRMAQFYLNLAEAYNEQGNSSEALNYLNTIRDRGGLGYIAVSDQTALREEIQREWAVEFYGENKHYAHARHWKKGDVMIGGPKHSFKFQALVSWDPKKPEQYGDYWLSLTRNYAWNPNMHLSPITLSEVNKGYITQNPGY